MPGGDQQRGDRERDHERRPEVRLDHDQQAGRTHRRPRSARPPGGSSASASGARPGSGRRTGRARASSPPRAGTGSGRRRTSAWRPWTRTPKPGHEHEHAAARTSPSSSSVTSRRSSSARPRRSSTCIATSPTAPNDEVADELAGAVALAAEHADRRGRAVDHHRAEREQAQRRGHQDPVLERRRDAPRRRLRAPLACRDGRRAAARPRALAAAAARAISQPSTSSRKCSPRASKSRYWS